MVKLSRLLIIAWAAIPVIALLSGAAAANAACPQVGFTIVESHASPATRPVKVGKNQTLFVRRVPITTTSDIAQIRLVGDDDDDDASLLIKFTPAADQRLHEATTGHSGMRIAFMFNDEVLVNTVWEGRYGMDLGGTTVSIRHGMKRAQRLMKAIRGCTGAAAVGGVSSNSDAGGKQRDEAQRDTQAQQTAPARKRDDQHSYPTEYQAHGDQLGLSE